jgi:hypothetical protein
MTDFGGGQYLVWDLETSVRLRLTNTKLSGPGNAVLSGLFLGPTASGSGTTVALASAALLPGPCAATPAAWASAAPRAGVPIGPPVADELAAPASTRVGLNMNMEGGRWTLSVAAPAGAKRIIEASDDLVNWTTLDTVTVSPDGLARFVDPSAANPPQRLYRAVVSAFAEATAASP